MVEITREEYLELVAAQRKLACLEAWGVDNWEGYDEAMEDYVDPEDEMQED